MLHFEYLLALLLKCVVILDANRSVVKFVMLFSGKPHPETILL